MTFDINYGFNQSSLLSFLHRMTDMDFEGDSQYRTVTILEVVTGHSSSFDIREHTFRTGV